MKARSNELVLLRALARHEGHSGYVWAAVMDDGELMCVTCVRNNYRRVFKCTRDHVFDGFMCIGIANSGESEQMELCCNCNKTLWTE